MLRAGRKGSCRLWAPATTSVEGDGLVGTRRRLRDESGYRAEGRTAAVIEERARLEFERLLMVGVDLLTEPMA